MGVDAALAGSAIAMVGGLLSQLIGRIKCLYQRDEDGNCSPKCGCLGSPLVDDHTLEVRHEEVGGVEVLVISKK